MERKKKSIGGYVWGIVILFVGLVLLTGSHLSPNSYGLSAIILFIVVIGFILVQYVNNSIVPENNILFKYLQYIKEAHSEIPEKYYEAILSDLRDLHNSSFGGFNETNIFSAEELDMKINEFMKDADQNLMEYAKKKLVNK